MSPATAIALLFAVVVLATGARLCRRALRAPASQRPRAWRIAVLLLLQVAGAWLLYRTLFPPPVRSDPGALVVLTADAGRVDAAPPAGARVVALPEAHATGDAVRVPDLATALRRHPRTTRLFVRGAGLPPRDLDAARGVALDFAPAPLPRGLVALWPPRGVVAGNGFRVAGRAHALAGGSVELLDPAGAVAARAAPGVDGGFVLRARAGAAGPATWRLRLRDGTRAVVEDVPLPLDVADPAPLRVLALAGAPDPELKYLRRWAGDAGLALDARIELGAGMQIGDAPAALDAGRLARYDLVVLDARSWRASAARREVLLRAADDGLGLLLRLPDAGAADRAALRRLGFDTAVGPAGEARLPASAATGQDGALPALVRGPLRLRGNGAAPLLAAADGEPLAAWRAHGRGRIGVAAFDGSWRLVLAGRGERHGALWAGIVSTLARARDAAPASFDVPPRAGERVAICGLAPGATVEAPDGRRTRLRLDPRSGHAHCAGFWPRIAGWHLLREPASAPATGERRQHVHVRAADEAPGLRAAALREATTRLAAAGAERGAVHAPGARGIEAPGPRWPWFLAWLALAAAGWWFERARPGTARGAARMPG